MSRPDNNSRANCPACAGSSVFPRLTGLQHHYRLGAREYVWDFTLARCQDCGLGFIDPLPEARVLSTCYPAHYGSYIAAERPEVVARSVKYRVAKARGESSFGRSAAGLIRAAAAVAIEVATGRTTSYSLSAPLQLPREARILDVGFGAGSWLLAMRVLGYTNLHGFDIGSNAANVQRLARSGVQVHTGDLGQVTIPDCGFDCVRLEHVFEHLSEPAEALAICSRLLRPGGMLVMTFPCLDSWTAMLALEHSPALDLPRHLYHHTEASARLMVARAGFDYIQTMHIPVVGHMLHAIACRVEIDLPSVARIMSRALAPWYSLISRLSKRGEHLAIIAYKPYQVHE